MEGISKQDVGMGSSSQDLKDIDFKVCTGHSLRDLTSCAPGLRARTALDIDFKVCTGHSLRDLTSCAPGLRARTALDIDFKVCTGHSLRDLTSCAPGLRARTALDIDFKVCTGHSLRDLTSEVKYAPATHWETWLRVPQDSGLGPHLLRFVLRVYTLAHLLSQIVLDSALDHQKLSGLVV